MSENWILGPHESKPLSSQQKHNTSYCRTQHHTESPMRLEECRCRNVEPLVYARVCRRQKFVSFDRSRTTHDGQHARCTPRFSYLELDPLDDADLGWVVQSLAEIELPSPWTSYNGVGSIVCFFNHETGKTTWKHPFYDYFVQLREFARTKPPDQVKQVVLVAPRLMWGIRQGAGYYIHGECSSISSSWMVQLMFQHA